jgi:hypothetical protein
MKKILKKTLETIVEIIIDEKTYKFKILFPSEINLKDERWYDKISIIPEGAAPDFFHSHLSSRNQFLAMPGVLETIKEAIIRRIKEEQNEIRLKINKKFSVK